MGATSSPRFFGDTFPKADKYMRLPFHLWLSGTLGNRTGTNSDGVLIGSFTRAAVGHAYILDESAGTYADETTDINSAGAGDVTLFPASEATNDAIFFGSSVKFAAIQVTLGTAGIGGTVAWEYWNGKAWTALTNVVDSSAGFTAGTSTYFVTWAVPSDWATTAVNSVTEYWVRARVTGVYSTNPVGTQAWIHKVNAGTGVAAPAHGYLDTVTWTAVTISGTTADTVLSIVNLTKGTATTVTITKALKAGSATVAATNGLYVERGDALLVRQLTQDGTTEYANMNLILNFKV
jgi:hypothetical protein